MGDVAELKPETKDYGFTIRDLRNGDTFTVGAMLAKVMGDDNLRWAASSGDNTVMMMAGLGAVLTHAPRDVQLFCADLIGIKRDFKDAKKAAMDRYADQLKEGQAQDARRRDAEVRGKDFDEPPVLIDRVTDESVRHEIEEEILEEFAFYPPGTAQLILTEVLEREDFVPFVHSSMRLAEAARGLSGKFSNPSSSGSDSRKKKS